MSETSTSSYPHQDKLAEYGIATSELSEKTQKRIAKFAAEADEEKKEALDEVIFGDIEDFMEAKRAKEKEAARKAAVNAHKETKKVQAAQKIDVSKAATATGKESTPPKEEKSFVTRMFGR